MNKIIFIKETQDYDKISKLKKILLSLKRKLNIVRKDKYDIFNIWTLPITGNITDKKFEKIIKKELKSKLVNDNTLIVLSNELKSKETIKILDKYNIKYINGNLAKKKLIFKVINYINKMQNTKQNEREITILVNEAFDININLITKLAFESKSIKIVSKHINKFRNLEEKLYSENGIAIQFSNSYKKSLKNADIIINLDFSKLEINEYEIATKAIIINTENKLKIKSKLFNGIVINSYNIKFGKCSKNINSILQLLKDFNNLEIYESLLIFGNSRYLLNGNSIKVLNTIGNNGIILENEFKNIS